MASNKTIASYAAVEDILMLTGFYPRRQYASDAWVAWDIWDPEQLEQMKTKNEDRYWKMTPVKVAQDVQSRIEALKPLWKKLIPRHKRALRQYLRNYFTLVRRIIQQKWDALLMEL